eukprot:GHVT01049523.1.p2 GENE.GHVT01049523.1~~GHVT01049523.1.p2  ORF type:complete len:168 (+),score=12.46 GHVT01049523.1:4100-4603(+)
MSDLIPRTTGMELNTFVHKDTFDVVGLVRIPKDNLNSWAVAPGVGVVHGGFVATLLDEISGQACWWLNVKNPVTRELNVTYTKPTMAGNVYIIKPRVVVSSEQWQAQLSSEASPRITLETQIIGQDFNGVVRPTASAKAVFVTFDPLKALKKKKTLPGNSSTTQVPM